jgi:hypothetical protein
VIEDKIILGNFVPRSYQQEIIDALDKGYKKLVVTLPRRSGKDITCWNIAIAQCIKKICLVQYVLPTLRQAKYCIFDAISIDGTKFIEYIPPKLIEKINIVEQEIVFTNGSVLQCLGANTYDTSIPNTNPYMVIFSEFACMNPEIYNSVRPILAANGGIVIFLSTPFGKNHYYYLFEMAHDLDDWYVLYKKTSEIKHIPEEELEKQRQQMSPELYQQEYECNFLFYVA